MKAVLFDLDGTLLPMDQDLFTGAYFKGIAAHLAPYGYDPKQLIDGIWTGTMAMIKNPGDQTNEAVFWQTFTSLFGEQVRADEPHFAEFYRTGFQKVREICGFDARAAEIVHWLQQRGVRVALATNPIFPAIATESRIRWAGLEPEDFELYTTYENISACKPNLAYYREILDRLGLAAEDCVMVGNDVGDDMVAQALGMQVFLLTDCLINRKSDDISAYPQGGFDELRAFLETILA